MSTPDSTDTATPLKPPLRSAVFVDKNGTLIDEVPNNVALERLRFRPTAFEAIRVLADQGHAIVVITNEPGLGLGLFNRAALTQLETAMVVQIREEAGVELAGFYTCPHKPGPRGEPACLCRVPAAGLLRQAAISLRLDLAKCWVIGDMLNDVEAGRRVGCRTVLVDGEQETNWRMSPLRTPHHRAATLLGAAHLVCSTAAVGADLSLEIELPDSVSTGGKPLSGAGGRHIGPLRGFEPHPTREWL
jgi:D-glycero-D-manno-heptose 1,7-bisphosphate phosphatase